MTQVLLQVDQTASLCGILISDCFADPFTLQNKGGDWTEGLEDTLGKVKQSLKLSRHRGECKAHLQVCCRHKIWSAHA